LLSRRFSTVIIGGLTAAESPVGAAESLSDELAQALGIEQEFGGEELARLRFYLAISRARDELVLIRKEETSSGATLRPSVLWEEVLDAYRQPGDSPEEIAPGAPTPIRVRAVDVVEAAPVFTPGRRAARMRAAGLPTRCAPTPRGTITDHRALEGLATTETFTASQVEAYLQCPYRWFYERVVRPGELDNEVDARAVGTLAHDVLSRFYRAWGRLYPGLRVTFETLGAAHALLAAESAEVARHIQSRGLADDLAIARGVRWATAIVEDDVHALPGFHPAEHEYVFGEEGSEVSVGGFAFRGKVDRIDRLGNLAIVTDYKSSREVDGVADFVTDGKIQAVVYAEAVRQLGDRPELAGSMYRSFRTHAMRGFYRADLLGGVPVHCHEDDAVSAEQYAELVDEVGALIQMAVAGIRNGDVPRRPRTKSACSHCPLAMNCEGAIR
jgi:RecB family exonuclease